MRYSTPPHTLQIMSPIDSSQLFFIHFRIYLILEKLKIIAYRSLFKKVWVLCGLWLLSLSPTPPGTSCRGHTSFLSPPLKLLSSSLERRQTLMRSSASLPTSLTRSAGGEFESLAQVFLLLSPRPTSEDTCPTSTRSWWSANRMPSPHSLLS